MIVNHTTDKSRIYKVLKHPDIWARIAEDGVTSDGFETKDGPFYLMDEEDIGLLIVEAQNSVTVDIHIQVLPEHRERAVEFALSAFDWIWKNTKCQKIVAQIPEIYPDVIRFAQKVGLSVEGVNNLSYMKDGKLYSQAYMGLSRLEVQSGMGQK